MILLYTELKNDVIDFKDAKEKADFIVYNNKDTVLQDVVFKVWSYVREERGSE